MKLYLQDRGKIIEMPKEVWVAQDGEKHCIIGTAYISPIIGFYDNESRAKEVLQQMFEFYRNGKNSYVIPEQ